jgi:hypothetical protein
MSRSSCVDEDVVLELTLAISIASLQMSDSTHGLSIYREGSKVRKLQVADRG